jgi:hypothetical protein
MWRFFMHHLALMPVANRPYAPVRISLEEKNLRDICTRIGERYREYFTRWIFAS